MGLEGITSYPFDPFDSFMNFDPEWIESIVLSVLFLCLLNTNLTIHFHLVYGSFCSSSKYPSIYSKPEKAIIINIINRALLIINTKSANISENNVSNTDEIILK